MKKFLFSFIVMTCTFSLLTAQSSSPSLMVSASDIRIESEDGKNFDTAAGT